MRRRLLISSLLVLAAPFGPSLEGLLVRGTARVDGAFAQEPPPASESAPAAEPAPPAEPPPAQPAPEPAASEPAAPTPEPGAAPALAPPALGNMELTPSVGPLLPEPAEAAAKLEQAAPPPPVEKKRWTLPETVFHLHGYFRLRGNLLKDGDLGHSPVYDRLPTGTLLYGGSQDPNDVRQNYDPFQFFAPADSTNVATAGSTQNVTQPPVSGGCGDKPGADGKCSKKTQTTGDMRLRLKPEVHLSDDIRVKAWIDVLDNVGLGTMGYGPTGGYQNNIDNIGPNNVIRVRRAWAEARNRDIGELRFGRMGADWGLGILDNGGDRYGIDSDFSSDVDRIMGITNLAGFYLMAAYDWANEGLVLPGTATPNGVAIDRAQKDDLNVFTTAAAHKLDPELQQSALMRGEAVFNYGVYFVWRDQFLQLNSDFSTSANNSATRLYNRFNSTQYIPDLWFQFLWEGLRVELESVFVAGSLEGGCPKLVENANPNGDWRNGKEISATHGDGGNTNPGNTRSSSGQCKFRQLGIALETEYRLFDDRLGIYFMSGLASGDANAYGLAATNDPSFQRVQDAADTGNRTISTYQFHPDYRVDLILWRTIMRRVAGGYYFKPGVSYDFIHDSYGQRAGGRLDVIYSRAASPKQTWGNSGNLGLEMDLSLYYRSEDGPDPMDGFYGLVQFGMLFPFQGLDYLKDISGAPSSANALIFRGVAGVAF